MLEPLLGGDMFNLLTSSPRGVVSCEHAAFYGACVLAALGHVHANSVVYRDVKPENVMIAADGYLKLVDFGYAKRLAERTYSVVGRVEYLAPEVLLQRGHWFGADWWALGVLIYEMVCGCTPFTNMGHERDERVICANIASGKYEWPLPTHLGEALCGVVRGLLTRERATRLGCGGGGSRDVASHPFFAHVDMDALLTKSVPPPHVPTLSGPLDMSNFSCEETVSVAGEGPYPDDINAWDRSF